MNLFLIQTIQRDSAISFPMLGNLTINPPASISIGNLHIYFYGIIIAIGFITGIFVASHNSPKFGIKDDDLFDIILWTIPMAILGARLYFVLFKLDYYLAHPSEILAVWEGGLAIYGGVIAGAITILFVTKRKKIPTPAALDLIIISCILGQAIGRWGNFMNREAFGAETEIFCRMGLTTPAGETIYVHPTFLYESLWNLAGYIFLQWFVSSGKRQFDGQCILMYCVWYGLGRVWIEGLRTDSLYLGSTGIRISQALSAVLVVFGVTMLILLRHRHSLYVESQAEEPDSAEPISD